MNNERVCRFWRRGHQVVLSALIFVCARTVAQDWPFYYRSKSSEAKKACQDFDNSSLPGLPWTFDDCLNVWVSYHDTLEVRYRVYPPHVDTWRTTAEDLRRAGSPCLLTSMPSSDGVGSVTIRHFSNWILAKELGCDWVTPEWGTKALKMLEYNKTSDVVYCHSHASLAERGNFTQADFINSRRCTIVNWLQYFNFGVPSTDVPQGVIVKTVEDVSIMKASVLDSVKAEINGTAGMASLPWDRLVITMVPTLSSKHFVATGSWGERKNEIVRGVLQEARQNFHQHPRPWYDEDLQCAFDPTRLNFSVHVRLGDRVASAENLAKHFRLLEELMDIIASVMRERRLQPPLFHVFSETEHPCPSPETGLFDEFPVWPVELDQVPPCLTAEAPKNCPLRDVQRGCFPERSGIFRVQDKPIVLHVSPDVTNALSCMIHSDGVVMGCSTFGQIAGLLTKGISFFSMGCKGDVTPVQYKTIPPIAVAERGHLWVPLSGSWHDPTLESTHILRRALDTVMEERASG